MLFLPADVPSSTAISVGLPAAGLVAGAGAAARVDRSRTRKRGTRLHIAHLRRITSMILRRQPKRSGARHAKTTAGTQRAQRQTQRKTETEIETADERG